MDSWVFLQQPEGEGEHCMCGWFDRTSVLRHTSIKHRRADGAIAEWLCVKLFRNYRSPRDDCLSNSAGALLERQSVVLPVR